MLLVDMNVEALEVEEIVVGRRTPERKRIGPSHCHAMSAWSSESSLFKLFKKPPYSTGWMTSSGGSEVAELNFVFIFFISQ